MKLFSIKIFSIYMFISMSLAFSEEQPVFSIPRGTKFVITVPKTKQPSSCYNEMHANLNVRYFSKNSEEVCDTGNKIIFYDTCSVIGIDPNLSPSPKYTLTSIWNEGSKVLLYFNDSPNPLIICQNGLLNFRNFTVDKLRSILKNVATFSYDPLDVTIPVSNAGRSSSGKVTQPEEKSNSQLNTSSR